MNCAADLARPVMVRSSDVRVLIVDDSAVARAALSRMVADAPGFVVAAALDGARRAIDWFFTAEADIVLLDIQMPGIDGLTALPALLEASGGARVIVVSTLAGNGTRATIEALALGAADAITKPDVEALGRQFGARLVDKMRSLDTRDRMPNDGVRSTGMLRTAPKAAIACVAIGASTGGLHALAAFFKNLPAAFDAPILITQHLPQSFMTFFAEQLAAMSGRVVKVARDADHVVSGTVLVAPGDAHLAVERVGQHVKVRLADHRALSGCCPSVDPMFASVGAVYGRQALGVVLTGMGRDGATGARAMADCGGTVIVQDVVSATVWGMPGTVARAGLASLIAPPPALADYVAGRGSAK